MDAHTEPRITAVDKLKDRIVVEFGDGRCALFSARLLHDILPQAQLLEDEGYGNEATSSLEVC